MILLSLFSGIIYWQFNNIMQRQVLRDLNQIMIQDKVNIDNLTNALNSATLLLYTDQTIMKILNKEPSDYLQNFNDNNTINNELMKYLFIPLGSTLTSYSISFFVNDQIPFAKNFPAGDNLFFGFYNGKDVQSTPWFQDAVKADGRLFWFQKQNQKNQLYVARLIKNPETLSSSRLPTDPPLITNIGIIVIGFNVSQLGKLVEASQLTPSTQLLIIDQLNNILYHNDSANAAIPVSSYLDVKSGTIIDSGKKYLMNRQTLDSGWDLVALIPLNEISERSSIVLKIVGISGIALLCVGILLSGLISNKISAPIRKLARTMNNVKMTGNLNVNVQLPAGKDEISTLYKSFNTMMSRINQLISEVYESEIREKNAELKVLQAQINPHFLYNTLDSINWLAMESGNEQIVFINSALADLFRYITDNSNNLVTLNDELQQAKNYINLQSICYENRFTATYDIDPRIVDNNFLKLILQPLVENAILHGLEKMEQPGHIHISGYLHGNTVIVSISDNGTGADIDKLNAFLDGSLNQNVPFQSYGIKNVHQRIKLKFGEDYGLHYERNSSNVGITAVIILPLSTDRSRDASNA